MSWIAHGGFGVAFIAGLVLAGVSGSVAWGLFGFGVSAVAAGVWARLVARDSERWDDRGPRWP